MIKRRAIHGIALVVLLLLASACTNGGERTTGRPPADGAPGAEREAGDADPDGARTNGTPAIVPTRDEYIQNPFAIRETTTAAVTRAFGQPERIQKEPVENRHIPGQVDTLVTLHYGDATFEFYRVTDGREFLDHASVRSNRYLRYPRPGIGTPVDSLVSWFGPPTTRSNGRLRYERTEFVGAEEPVIFVIEDGRIRRIEFLGYVD